MTVSQRFPLGIDGSNDYILFTFGEYKSPLTGTKGKSGSPVYDQNESVMLRNGKTIALNMPNDIGTSFSGAWSGKNTTSLAQAAIAKIGAPIAKSIKKGDASELTGIFSDPAKSFKAVAKAAGDDAVRFLAESFAAAPGLGANLTANDILQLSAGTILNPNTELLYGGPSLRTHGYTFKMIPQSSDEAKEVLEIVKIFKQACLPKVNGAIFGTSGRNFITIPDVCEVTFMQGNSENKNLPKYKASGITSVSVSYITDGNYMSFNDGRPIGVQLTVALTETKLVFREDIGVTAN